MSFPQTPESTVRVVSIFFSRKFEEILPAQGAPSVSLTPVANEKIFKLKSFNYFLITFEYSRVKGGIFWIFSFCVR
jgi:hypothetical protein